MSQDRKPWNIQRSRIPELAEKAGPYIEENVELVNNLVEFSPVFDIFIDRRYGSAEIIAFLASEGIEVNRASLRVILSRYKAERGTT